MSETAARPLGPDYAQLCDQLGARLLHSLNDQELIAQQLKHSELVSELLSQGYRQGSIHNTTSELQFALLRLLSEHANCQSAMLVELDPVGRGMKILAALGCYATQPGFVPVLPQQRLVAADDLPQATDDWLRNLIKQPAVAWYQDPDTGRGLLLGNYHEASLRTPFSSVTLKLLATINQMLRELEQRLNDEERIRFHATRDPLTKLPNQTLALERLQQAIEQLSSPVTGQSAAPTNGFHLVRLDVDDFRRLNELMGHDNGDRLLAEIAQRLAPLLPTGSTLARMGGDEFLLLLDESSPQAVELLCRDLMRHAGGTYQIQGHTPQITLSLGIARCPQDGIDSTSLLKYSDQAMEQAKRNGRNQYRFYSPDIGERHLKHWQLRSALQDALRHNQLQLFYQPIFSLADQQLVHFEALLRWSHPQLGQVSPAEFIPVAEADDTIVQLGDWVVAESCRQLAQWRSEGHELVPIAINISARQLQQADFVDSLLRHLGEYGLRPEHLELELTERLLLQQETVGDQLFQQLADLGFSLELDDFGTGYSALSYLNRYPFSALKIDRSFVDQIEHNPRQRTLVRGVVALAHELGLKTIAEGVETAAQLQLLTEIGCDLAQGYYLGRPGSIEQCHQFLSAEVA